MIFTAFLLFFSPSFWRRSGSPHSRVQRRRCTRNQDLGYPQLFRTRLYRRGDGHDGERDDVGRHTMIVQGLEASIDVDQEGYANIVVISVTDTNPIMARNLANRLAEV